MTAARYLALADGLYAALQARHKASTGEEVLKARHALAAVLAGLCGAARGIGPAGKRRGRKPVHDRVWVDDNLLDMIASDPDGLPALQRDLAGRLRLRFENAGRPVPGDTWLKEAVSEFYHRAQSQDTEAREKFRQSPALQSAFETAAAFAAFCRARDRLEKQWLSGKALQRRFKTSASYVAAVIAARPLPVTAVTSPELPPSSGLQTPEPVRLPVD